jgi:hypothetical protein
MRRRKNSPLWKYLEDNGVLEKGSDAEIKAVRKAYWKKYFLEYKQKQRKNKPEYIVHFSKNNGEHGRILEAAMKHQMKVPAFLKASAFAYLGNTYVVPNRLMIAHLEQILSDCLNEIKAIAHTKERFWEREQKLDRIEKRIENLEEQMNEAFRNPALFSHDHQNQIAQA